MFLCYYRSFNFIGGRGLLSRESCLNKQLEEGWWSKWWACGLWFWDLKFAYFEVLSWLGCIPWTGLLWLVVVELTTRTNKEANSPSLDLVKFGSIRTSRLPFPFLGIVLSITASLELRYCRWIDTSRAQRWSLWNLDPSLISFRQKEIISGQ